MDKAPLCNPALQNLEHPTLIEIKDILQELNELEDMVIIPMDKTNSFAVLHIDQYISEVRQHLEENAVEIERFRLTEIFDECHRQAQINMLSLSP